MWRECILGRLRDTQYNKKGLKMRTALGIILISLPFITIATFSIRRYGFWNTVMVFGLALAITACVFSGGYLLFEI
jgi:hypothetical protein